MQRWLAGLLPALGVLALAGCPGPGDAPGRQALDIKGSDTMVHLVTSWAEAYMEAHPGAEITVTGGGSGTGIAAMINGTTDLAMSSREMSAEELEAATRAGARPVQQVVGSDGIAVVVHPENPVDALTMDQLRQIFNGTLTSWQDVGGPDQPFQLLSRETNSGTYVFFNEHVLEKDDFAPAARLMPSTAAITRAVGQDRWSIGYVGLGYTKDAGVKVLKIKKDEGAPAVVPAVATVQDGSYPISRPLLLYTRGEPAGVALELLGFARSPEGQRIVAETGYIPLVAPASPAGATAPAGPAGGP